MSEFNPENYLSSNRAAFMAVALDWVQLLRDHEALAKGRENFSSGQSSYAIAEARKNLPDILGRAHYAEQIIELRKHDKPLALVVGRKTLDVLERHDAILIAFNDTAKIVEGKITPENKQRVCAGFYECLDWVLKR